MTTDQVIELAKQAGIIHFTRSGIAADSGWLQRFAELVRNQTLEEAAKSCNELIEADNSDDYKAGVTWCAMRIERLKS